METNNKFKIFLVDDNPVCINMYKRFLNKMGYQAISSFNGSADLLKAIAEKPDLIFLDYYLDELNGMDLLQLVKKRFPNTVIVLISGQKDLMVAVKSLQKGAFDYIIKDEFTADKMELIVSKAVSIRAAWARKDRKTAIKKLVSATGLVSLLFFFKKRFFILAIILLGEFFAAKAQTGNYPCLNIQNFGVVVNGAGDCSDSLQRAIESAAVTGSAICMPAGIYRTSKTINLLAGVSLIGAGMGTNADPTPYNGTLIYYTGDSAAITITGTNSAIKDLTVYNFGGTASAGVVLLADSELLESVAMTDILIYGFTGGTAFLLQAEQHGGIGYCSFYDVFVRHARIGIHILQSDTGSFVNSNSFFHGAVSGGGFDDCILVDGGDNNVFYSTVIEPYTSTYGHLVVNTGQITGENIRVEADRQPAGTPVINFGPNSALSSLTGFYGGGLVINQGNNTILLASPGYTGENNPGYNQFINAAFLLPASNGIPAYWTVSNPTVIVTTTTEQVIVGEKVLSVQVPPGVTCDFYPVSGYAPALASNPLYTYANFNLLAKTTVPGVVKLTYNYSGGLVSSVAQNGSGTWETIGLQVMTSPLLNPNPKINLNNSAGTDTLTVGLTSPSFNFGSTVPQRDAAVITAAGGIITGTLTTSVTGSYSFIGGTNYLVLPNNGNAFVLTGTLTISRINYLTAGRFPSGTIINLLFNNAGITVQSGAYISLKSSFTASAANTSLTLLSNGDGTWREVNRNN
jgi:FixJ family two-component response regulator